MSTVNNSLTTGPTASAICGGVFYAYIHNIKDDNTWRMTIIFASSDVADEWWRAVSTSTITQLKDNIQRVTSQFYTHNPDQWNFYNFFTESAVKTVSDLFRGKMFFVLENDRGGRGITIIPPQYVAGCISGSSFCIRCKSDPQQYWDIDEQGRVYVSNKARTSFVVTALNVSKEAILIGSDLVTISTSRGVVDLQKSDDSLAFSHVKTTSSGSGQHFTFRDLKEGRFFVGECGLVCFTDQDKCGMAWELAA